ncbi:hypothetical protein [Helicobacter felistomachi]|uniref:hypothetical protein n=1 Tax=Helicobacter felistomachi TaxID=3040201 RepID=UPI0025724339|nr:hypothetical protein [Helicobacter sp. NHP21005]
MAQSSGNVEFVYRFFRGMLIGDNLVCIPAMAAIKALYPSCKLVVYTNTIGKEL